MHRIGGPLEVSQIPSQWIPQGVSPSDKLQSGKGVDPTSNESMLQGRSVTTKNSGPYFLAIPAQKQPRVDI